MPETKKMPIYNFITGVQPTEQGEQQGQQGQTGGDIVSDFSAILLESWDVKPSAPGQQSDTILAKIQESLIPAAIKENEEYRFKNFYEVYLKKLDQPKATRGYIPQDIVDELDSTIVDIPQNFAGLEAEMVPTRLQNQLFRIYSVVEGDDYVEISARLVWYDNLQNYTLWKPDENTRYTAAACARNILSNAVSPANTRVASDCTEQIIGKDLDFERKNIVEAFLDPEKGLCKKFDLSMIRDNWDCYVLKEVGYNRGFVVEDNKNLLGVERTESIEGVATRICPYGKAKNGDIIWLNNNGKKWIDSEHIDDYVLPRVELYDTKLQVDKDDVTERNIQQKLLEAGQKRFSEDHVDLPSVEMKIEFLSLGDTEEYAQYRGLDKVYLYDIISIKDKVRGYQYTAQVVAVEHDILTGMLNSVTIGKLDNWDGTRKIAVWQVPEINGENIRLKSIMAGAFSPGAILGDDIANGSITADKIRANSITANEIEAGSITADRLDVDDLAAAFAEISVLEASIATIAEASIASASIGFAQIVDANIQNLIAHDAVTDRYYINKLAVDNATFVHAVVGDLVVKAADNKYYKLVINADGSITPQEVTLTIGEINAGITSDGRGSIVETDLTVTELAAGNMKAINALIDKLTASRIDVDLLFAREASISKLHSTSILGNKLLALTVTGGSEIYEQYSDPAINHVVKDGDRWKKTVTQGSTWSDFWNYTISQIEDYELQYFGNSELYIRNNGMWEFWTGDIDVMESTAELILTGDAIRQMVSDKYGHVSGIEIESLGVAITGNKYIKLDVDQDNFVHISGDGIDMKGCRVMINGTDGMWARDDIIVMNPNDQSSWRRTVAGIESHMAGQHDWVMIRPFYDASIAYAGVTGQAQQQTPINNKYTESGSSGKAFGGAADWYNYAITLALGNTASVMRQLTVQLFLANKPFEFDNSSADRRVAAAQQANVICPAVTGTIGANNTLTLNISSGHVGYNLCGENNEIYYYIYGLNYEGMNVNGNTMIATTDTTNGRVPCTVYYYS